MALTCTNALLKITVSTSLGRIGAGHRVSHATCTDDQGRTGWRPGCCSAVNGSIRSPTAGRGPGAVRRFLGSMGAVGCQERGRCELTLVISQGN